MKPVSAKPYVFGYAMSPEHAAELLPGARRQLQTLYDIGASLKVLDAAAAYIAALEAQVEDPPGKEDQ